MELKIIRFYNHPKHDKDTRVLIKNTINPECVLSMLNNIEHNKTTKSEDKNKDDIHIQHNPLQ